MPNVAHGRRARATADGHGKAGTQQGARHGARASRTRDGCADVSGRSGRRGGRLQSGSWQSVRRLSALVRRSGQARTRPARSERRTVSEPVTVRRLSGEIATGGAADRERHGAHGTGHRDAAADRGGREPVRHTGRHGKPDAGRMADCDGCKLCTCRRLDGCKLCTHGVQTLHLSAAVYRIE